MGIADQARQALDKEEAPARRAREDQEAQRRASREEAARKQAARDARWINKSGIKTWFPESRWKVVAHAKFVDAAIVEPEEQEQFRRIELMIFADGTVRWANQGWLERIENHREHPLFQYGGLCNKHDYWGAKVTSAADVGRELRRIDDIFRSMPAHLP
jgi:hypothetical protein